MGLFKTRVFPAAAALVVVCTAPQTFGGEGYLHRIGPAPLRFSLGTATFSFTLPAILQPPPTATNSTDIPAAETNCVDVGPTAFPEATVPLPTNMVPNSTSSASPDNPSASDMLPVSTQMLTDYFKPGLDGTNSAAPAPVGFTPPLVKPSSQATYRSP